MLDYNKDSYEIIANEVIVRKNKSQENKVSFTIKPGDFVYVIGCSGVGKSNLLKKLCGYNKGKSDDLSFILKDERTTPRKYTWQNNNSKLKNAVGYVPQEDTLYEELTPAQILSAYYNSLPNKENLVGISTALSLVKIEEKAHMKVKELSGGERKRLSIAIELLRYKSLKILILDEPDSGLDPYNRNNLHLLLRAISSSGITIILSTHFFERKEDHDLIIFIGENREDNETGYYQDLKKIIENKLSKSDEKAGNLGRGSVSEYTPQRPKLLALVIRDLQLYFGDVKNRVFFMLVPFLCMLFLSMNTNETTFEKYESGIPVICTIASAAILLGLMLSINLICKDHATIKRELRKGISSCSIITSKTILLILMCLVMSSIMILPYIKIYNLGQYTEGASSHIFITVFTIMLVSSEMGLLVSSIPKIKPQTAANFVPLVMIYQILFSGFLFNTSRPILNGSSISNHAVKALGNALNFKELRSVPLGAVFNNALVHDLTIPLVVFIVCFVFSIIFLKFVDFD
jgi:ABC-type multidrug transport system ATPase subunit